MSPFKAIQMSGQSLHLAIAQISLALALAFRGRRSKLKIY